MPLGIYLHYPFCSNRCDYCDFYKEVYEVDAEREFFAALRSETDLAIDRFQLQDRHVTSLFIGGGTPSLAHLDLLAEWVAQIRSRLNVNNNAEFSVESNPESVSLPLLRSWRELGVNRPLFGIQSFDTKLLRRLGRRHRPVDSQRAIYHANALGYRNYGVDMIFGLPGQTTKMLSADLDQILDLEPPHVSFYQLTLESGTRMARTVARGRIRLPDQETSAAMYRGGVEKLAESGYDRYEVSSFARKGFECRHNLGYWVGDDYLGLGPSAHSFIDGNRFANCADLRQYVSTVNNSELPHTPDRSGPEERMAEAIMLGLRLTQGISREQFHHRFGFQVDDRLDPDQYRILIDSEHLVDSDDHLRLSADGLCLADEITRRLLV